MPTVCRYKPNRSHPRLIGATDAARMVCGALNNPEVTQTLIEAELQRRDCGWTVNDPQCEDRRRKLKQVALELVEGNNQVIAIGIGALGVIAAQLAALAVIVRLFPLGGGPASRTVVGVRQGIRALQTRMQVQKAANDDIFRLVSGL